MALMLIMVVAVKTCKSKTDVYEKKIKRDVFFFISAKSSRGQYS